MTKSARESINPCFGEANPFVRVLVPRNSSHEKSDAESTLYESHNTAIPISNLSTSLSNEGIRATTILIGNVIAERDSVNRRMFRNSAEAWTPSLSSTTYSASIWVDHSTKEPRKERWPCRPIQASANIPGYWLNSTFLHTSFYREHFSVVFRRIKSASISFI